MSPELLFPLLGLLLVISGCPLATRRVRPNRWYGLRVPATFADPTVWNEANAIAGGDMVRLGSVVTALALALPRVTKLPSDIHAGWRSANGLLRKHRAATGAT